MADNNHTAEAVEKMDQIRNLILGDSITILESRVAFLETSVEKLQKRADDLERENRELNKSRAKQTDLETVQSEMAAAIEQLKKNLMMQLNDIEDKKLDKDSIADVFIQWGQKLVQPKSTK